MRSRYSPSRKDRILSYVEDFAPFVIAFLGLLALAAVTAALFYFHLVKPKETGRCERAAERLLSEDWHWSFSDGCWVEYEGRMFRLDSIRVEVDSALG